MGMHIADDGIVLAAAKRIVVDGEIPHRDFISLRPVGTFFFWAPTLLFGGEYVNTLSRLITMLQFALIAFFWISLFEKLYDIKLRPYPWLCLYIITYFFSFNTFWLFPLYTTDGVFFSSLGCWLIFKEKEYFHYLGFFMIGVACLAKQNFAAMIPATLIASNSLKNPKAYLSALIAPLSYIIWLRATGGLEDFQIQMSQYTFSNTFIKAGVLPYLKSKYFFMGIALALLSLVSKPSIRKYTFNTARIVFGIHIVQTLLLRGYLSRVPIFLAGFALVLMASFFLKNKKNISTYLFLSCGLAWVSSFSLVFQYPHAAGYLIPAIFFYLFKDVLIQTKKKYKALPAVICLIIATGFSFHRYKYTFENNTAFHTPHVIDTEYPGAKGMVVGDLMFKVFSNLTNHYERYSKRGKEVAIIPDFTNFWVVKEKKTLCLSYGLSQAILLARA